MANCNYTDNVPLNTFVASALTSTFQVIISALVGTHVPGYWWRARSTSSEIRSSKWSLLPAVLLTCLYDMWYLLTANGERISSSKQKLCLRFSARTIPIVNSLKLTETIMGTSAYKSNPKFALRNMVQNGETWDWYWCLFLSFFQLNITKYHYVTVKFVTKMDIIYAIYERQLEKQHWRCSRTKIMFYLNSYLHCQERKHMERSNKPWTKRDQSWVWFQWVCPLLLSWVPPYHSHTNQRQNTDKQKNTGQWRWCWWRRRWWWWWWYK